MGGDKGWGSRCKPQVHLFLSCFFLFARLPLIYYACHTKTDTDDEKVFPFTQILTAIYCHNWLSDAAVFPHVLTAFDCVTPGTHTPTTTLFLLPHTFISIDYCLIALMPTMNPLALVCMFTAID